MSVKWYSWYSMLRPRDGSADLQCDGSADLLLSVHGIFMTVKSRPKEQTDLRLELVVAGRFSWCAWCGKKIRIKTALGMARVNEGSHSFTCHPHAYPRMDRAIWPLIPASPHFSLYSFPVPQRVAGWVGPGGWLHTDVVCLPELQVWCSDH